MKFIKKDFLKCTPSNHPDYQLLIKAQIELHNLAERIDKVHKENNESYGVDQQSILQIIQDLIENLDDVRVLNFNENSINFFSTT
jgi:hypothetical protein